MSNIPENYRNIQSLVIYVLILEHCVHISSSFRILIKPSQCQQCCRLRENNRGIQYDGLLKEGILYHKRPH